MILSVLRPRPHRSMAERHLAREAPVPLARQRTERRSLMTRRGGARPTAPLGGVVGGGGP